jgi:predicted dehydrogenase
MGLGRGKDHLQAWSKVPNVEIAGLCDVDSRRLAEGAAAVAKTGQQSQPKCVDDFRRLLEDKEIDVLSIASPNFWHAPAAILACSAQKHVYVEKPGSHTAWEGEMLVKAARRHNRRVQQGTQRRSLPSLMEAVQKLKDGAIGKVRSVRTFYDNGRGPVKLSAGATPPAWLNWTMWQGPCPEKPYLDNLVHYNWHWRWQYGGGEMGNNGVHALDLALWGLTAIRGALPLPRRVTCLGGRYHFQDDQETPDTTLAAFDFGDVFVQFDSSSCHQRRGADQHAFCTFYGENGALAMGSAGYKIFDPTGKETEKNEPPFSDLPHFQNLADAIREGKPLNCEIETGQASALLCHLANIAFRTSGALEFDPDKRKIRGSDAGAALWSKEYRSGWEPQ